MNKNNPKNRSVHVLMEQQLRDGMIDAQIDQIARRIERRGAN